MRKKKLRIGLCLSGGGVYGAFQAGLIQSLYEGGVHIDVFAGSSIGAINSVLASDHESKFLQNFWLNLPNSIQREMEFAQKQWVGCLLSLGRANRIGTKAGRDYANSHNWLEKVKKWLVSDFEYECRRVGREEARNYINSQIREIEEKGPLISIKAVDYMRKQLSKPNVRSLVYATVCELQEFKGKHIEKMNTQKHCEVTDRGHHKPVERGNAVEMGLASASLPLVFGRMNTINPTNYMDGGLYDNLPCNILQKHLDDDEIDCLLIVDISRSAKAFRDEVLGWRVRRNTPCLYVGLSKTDDPLKHLLDFSMAARLYKLGHKTGQKAVRQWFSDGFDPVASFLTSPSILPETHVIRAV